MIPLSTSVASDGGSPPRSPTTTKNGSSKSPAASPNKKVPAAIKAGRGSNVVAPVDRVRTISLTLEADS
jgi:hypothetical protein